MSEDMQKYVELSQEKEKLLFLAKRLADITKDMDSLNKEDKRYVIERADMKNPVELVELYNALGEYI